MYRLDQTQPAHNLSLILQRHTTDAAGAGGAGSCAAGQTCAKELAAVGEMAEVIRRFALRSFEGKEAEFVLPEQDLTDDVIYPDDPVRKLTAASFLDVVLDRERDVVVKFFAPWCGHCKSMKTAYMELSDAFDDAPSIVIAEFDATAHQVLVRDTCDADIDDTDIDVA